MSVIHALERCTPAERKQIETILRDRAFNGVTHADILTILNRYASLEFARKRLPAMLSRLARRSASFPTRKSSVPCSGRPSLWWREKSSTALP